MAEHIQECYDLNRGATGVPMIAKIMETALTHMSVLLSRHEPR